MIHIRVSYPPDEPTFDSVDAAIAANSRSQRFRHVESDTATIKGCGILEAAHTREKLWLALSGNHTLTLSTSPTGVRWSVDEPRPSESKWHGSGPLLLVAERGELVWDRPSILKDVIGRRISMISPAFAWCFLYLGQGEPIVFMRMVEDGQNVLSWSRG